MNEQSSRVPPAADRWRGVDAGWGRRACEFATLSEPANCREYVALHEHLGIRAGERVLDIACGAGLALELAAARGALVAGIDASERLIRVACDRVPDGDVRVGDMEALPWPDASFDVVTSFRGIWGTTPTALREALRVLAPGGRLGITVWGHIKRSPGAWALAPFSLAESDKVEHQAAMVALGHPGVGESFVEDAGFIDVQRVDIPCAWEFATPDDFARALASTGPAFEAIEAVGEEEFLRRATALAQEHVRDGLPLRARIAVVGFVARKPLDRPAAGANAGFLVVPPTSEEIQALYDEDLEDNGYVMNVSRLWAHQPATQAGLFGLMGDAVRPAGITFRQRVILVSALASAFGDSYCSLEYGKKVAAEVGDELAAAVLRGDYQQLDATEQALARWARLVATDPNAITATDADELRIAGFDDAQIFAITTFLALRVAFSTVNDALGSRPDRESAESAPPALRRALTFGRPIGT